MSNDVDDTRLIEQARSGDRLALEKLLIAHLATITLHLAQRLPKSLQHVISVDDVVQEAMTQAFLKVSYLRDTSPRAFVAWLKAVGETTLIDLMRTHRRQKRGGGMQRIEHQEGGGVASLPHVLTQLPDQAISASSRLARGEAITALRVAMSSLPRPQQRAIHIHLIQGKTLDETAAQLNVTPAAVRGLVHRGKVALSASMGRASMWLNRK